MDPLACDRYVVKLGGENPLWALVRGTIREGKGVHREVESEESRIQNADLTNRKCMRQGPWDENARKFEVQYLLGKDNVYATG
jgi:hypothetical protein